MWRISRICDLLDFVSIGKECRGDSRHRFDQEVEIAGEPWLLSVPKRCQCSDYSPSGAESVKYLDDGSEPFR
jgi:hypothetical protein